MSHYFRDVCQFDNCHQQFPSLHELILHIEAHHIDFTAKTDVKPEPHHCVPLSSVFRYGKESEERPGEKSEKTNFGNIFGGHSSESIRKVTKRESLRKVSEEFRNQVVASAENNSFATGKKFSCPVIGCTKSYKNLNGMKYHILNYHDSYGNLIKPKKDFKCRFCAKEYKTMRGLQSHTTCHKDSDLSSSPLSLGHPNNPLIIPKKLKHSAASFHFARNQPIFRPGTFPTHRHFPKKYFSLARRPSMGNFADADIGFYGPPPRESSRDAAAYIEYYETNVGQHRNIIEHHYHHVGSNVLHQKSPDDAFSKSASNSPPTSSSSSCLYPVGGSGEFDNFNDTLDIASCGNKSFTSQGLQSLESGWDIEGDKRGSQTEDDNGIGECMLGTVKSIQSSVDAFNQKADNGSRYAY